jgi:hypothetical protein
VSWIDDAEKRWRAGHDRAARIEEHATSLYEALWAEVLRTLNGVKSSVERFADITTNGKQLAHVISFPEDARYPVPPRSVQIELQKSEHRIVTSGRPNESDLVIRFDIDICNADDSVCLKFEGKEVSYEEASRRILTALLYPGMPYVGPWNGAKWDVW